MKKIKELHFQPWVGPNYGKSKYGKLLLIGESHYLDEDEASSNLTCEVVKNALSVGDDMKTPFFRITELIFNCKEPDQLWNNVAYANLIQNGLSNSKSIPSQEDKATINPSFKLLLDNLRPEKVLVLSKRMWDIWLTEENGEQLKSISINGKSTTVWKYKYLNGECLAMGISHPSRIWGNSYKAWSLIVNKFLSMKL